MKLKWFVIFSFFVANVFTNVVVCAGLLTAEKQEKVSWIGNLDSGPSTDSAILFSRGLPPEIPAEEEHENSSSKTPNLTVEDEHFYEDSLLYVKLAKIKNWHLTVGLRSAFTEIVLPPPELS